ncbi:MAG: transglutaminase domain-containing protein [Proteobacteria bacterium]|nr:transglutaminase domain-containing protein [Pseudomonadota bacterium]
MKPTLFLFSFLLLTSMGLGSPAYLTGKDHFEFTYALTLPKLSQGQKGKVWLPVATSDRYQKVETQKQLGSLSGQTTQDPKFKNTVMVFEFGPDDAEKKLTYQYKAHRLEKADYPNQEKSLKAYLESEPLVPLDERFKKMAQEITQSKKTDVEKGRAIYDYVLSIMSYDKTGTGWGRGDAIYACDTKKGNCTDFHALFIAIARSAKIPSRFMVGFTIPSDKNEGLIEGYHCWAEFLADGKWIPVDISESKKHPEAREYYFGHHPANRFEMTRGRQLAFNPMPKEGPINFLVHPYIEVDGKSVKAAPEYFFRRIQ